MKCIKANNYRKISFTACNGIQGGSTAIPPWIFAALPLILENWDEIKSGFVDGYRDFMK